MTKFEPADYGPVFEPLLATDRCRALDAGEPNRNAGGTLERLTIDTSFAPAHIADSDMARCCLAGVWLLHDFLDRSHEFSQGIETPTGSYWHAIMHRREGDYSNAKYWLRRVGLHPVFDSLSRLPFEHHPSGRKFIRGDNWEPFAFVDACEQAVRSGRDADFCRAVQQAEWELLFDYCYRAAAG